MKKIVFALILLIIASLFASQKLFTPYFYTSHDGEGHVIRMEEFHQAMQDGQFPVRIAKRLDHGLGYPFFNFDYPGIYYAAEVLQQTGVSAVNTFKTLLILSVLIGGIGVFILCLFYFPVVSAFIAAIFYIFAPYHFLNIYVRADVAESMGLALIPWVFIGIELLARQKKYGKIVCTLSLIFLILSHNISVMIGIVLGVLYLIILIKHIKYKKHVIKQVSFCFIASFFVTAFFWIPVLIESHLVRLQELLWDYPNFFPTPAELSYSAWGFGSYVQGFAPGKMSPQIGPLHIFVFLLGMCFVMYRLLFKKKQTKSDRFFLFFCIVGIVCFLLDLSFSKPLWDIFLPLRFIQIPWRLVGYITFSSAIAVGYCLEMLPWKRITIGVCFVLILILLYSIRNEIRVNQYYTFVNPLSPNIPYGQSTTSKSEQAPIWEPLTYVDPNYNGDIIASTSGTSKKLVWKSNYHLFSVHLTTDADFRDNTSYYPGWEAVVDGKSVPILYQQDPFGRLRIHLTKGQHTIIFSFHETWYRLCADIISSTAIVILILWLAKSFLL